MHPGTGLTFYTRTYMYVEKGVYHSIILWSVQYTGLCITQYTHVVNYYIHVVPCIQQLFKMSCYTNTLTIEVTLYSYTTGSS